MTFDAANTQLAPYGYRVDLADGRIWQGFKPMGVYIRFIRGRWEARSITRDTLLWSGNDTGKFVSAFWFAKRKEAQ